MIILGATYVDGISGLTGVAVGHVEYITGCYQTLIQPKGKKDSKPEPHWIDDQRLSLVRTNNIKLKKSNDGFDKPANKI